MIVVALLGLALSIACYWIAFPENIQRQPRLFAAIIVLHAIASLTYWQYSLAFGADSLLYYTASAPAAFKPGTVFMIQFVQTIKSAVGGLFVDYFLLFQAFGVAGIALLMRSMYEILSDLGQAPDRLLLALFFLPGLHFWTSAIGKDAPLFFAVSLSVWSMIRIEHRFPALLLALAVMVPIRPHIAAIATVAFMATLMFDARIRALAKLPLGVFALVAGVWVISTAQQTFSLQSLDIDTLGDFVASKQEYGMRSAGGSLLAELPLPLKVASLLFRPFFFDATGFFGLVVSFENVAMLLIFGTIAARFKDLVRLCAAVPYMRYCLVFSVTLIILLSLVTYNVGLGLRQKYMAMPAVLMIFITLVAYRRAARGADYVEELHEPAAAGKMQR